MSDELDWGDDDEPVIPLFPADGKYHVDLCSDPECDRDDHITVENPFRVADRSEQ